MLLDMAPMEGITTAAFRRLHKKYFGGVDRCYAPFVSPTAEHRFTPRELRELLPENNCDLDMVPQLLCKNPEDFLWAAGELKAMGYAAVNLNAGCPSGTVTAKGKGAGLLASPEALESFLGAVFDRCPCRVSVKTRLGISEPEEFWKILEIYERFPIDELIIHPRVRKDFYREETRLEYFAAAAERCRLPLSLSGGIVTAEDCRARMEEFPGLRAVMLGQGLIADPFLAARVKGMPIDGLAAIRGFHDELFESYTEMFSSRGNAVERMKELWSYLIRSFDGGDKAGKRIRKARTPEEYMAAAESVFRDCPLREDGLA